MDDAATVRGLGVAVPVLAVVALMMWRRPDDRRLAAVLLATGWAAIALVAVNLLATSLGWWSFDADGAVWRGVPVDLWLAWSLLWGAVPALVAPVLPPVLVAAALVWIDLAFMPWGEPVVRLGPAWLLGEVVGVVVALGPAYALACWTLERRHVSVRGWAQAWCAGVLLLGLPLILLGVVPRWSREVTLVGIQLAVLVSIPAVAAMRDLARVGGGTPLPYDPPQRLVTTGPYAYVRNPMQVSMTALFAVLALALGDARLLLGAVVTVVYSAGLAAWHEGARMATAFGPAWTAYEAAVPAWIPRWRPIGTGPARLYVAADCSMCTGLGRWVLDRGPTAMEVRPAAEHPEVLWRLTYEADGIREQGVAAFARALGHVNLAWALAGWALAMPGVRHFAQLGADAFGAGPRPSR